MAQGMTQAQIAKTVVCSRSAVALAMDRLGIKARPNKVPEYPQLQDREWLAEQVGAGCSARDIATASDATGPRSVLRCASTDCADGSAGVGRH